jgi:hypothetical protein
MLQRSFESKRLTLIMRAMGRSIGYFVTERGLGMALSNAEKQARWRKRHADRRRKVTRITGLLMRQRLTNEHIAELAQCILLVVKRRRGKALHRELSVALQFMTQMAEDHAKHVEQERCRRDDWLAAHPGMTVKDFRWLRTTAVFKWLIAREDARRKDYYHEAIVKPNVDRQAMAWMLDG